MLRVAEGRADHLLLGDSVIVLDVVDGPPQVVEDRREPETDAPLPGAAGGPGRGHPRVREPAGRGADRLPVEAQPARRLLGGQGRRTGRRRRGADRQPPGRRAQRCCRAQQRRQPGRRPVRAARLGPGAGPRARRASSAGSARRSRPKGWTRTTRPRPVGAGRPPDRLPRVTDLRAAGVAETARLVASGEITARQATDAALERIERLNPGLNAISAAPRRPRPRRGGRARRQQGERGPLHGVPVVIKEEIEVEGCVTTFGGEANSTPAADDAEVVEPAPATPARWSWRPRRCRSSAPSPTPSPPPAASPTTRGTAPARPAAPAAVRRSPWPRAWSRSAWAATAAARSGSPARAAGCSGSSRSVAG